MAFLLVPLRIGLSLAVGIGRTSFYGGRIAAGGGSGGGGGSGPMIITGGGGGFNVTIKVHGLKELIRDLNRAERSIGKELQAALKDAAEPVLGDARGFAARWGPRTVSGLALSSTQGGVAVRQRRGRTTGKRPDFGRLQMQQALLPALERHQADVFRAAEAALDRVLRESGF